MLDIWKNAAMWHAINVHLPLVLAMVGLPLVAVMTIRRGRDRSLRWGMVAFYVLLVLSALYAVYTGERAMAALSSANSANAWHRVELHEWMAKRVSIFAGVTAFFLLLVNIPRVWARQTFLVLALIASLSTTGWVVVTGHLGGTAVYHYALGTPATEAGSEPAKPAIAKAPKNKSKPTAVAKAVAPKPAPSVATATPPANAKSAVPNINIVKAVSYGKDIKPILTARCVECHEGSDAKGAFQVSNVMLLKKNGRKAGPGVVPGDPAGSAIVQYITGKRQPQMPKGAKPLTADQIELIKSWIAQGAEDDTATAPVPAAANAPKLTADAAKTQATSRAVAANAPVPTTGASTAVATTSPSPTTQTVKANKAERVYDADEHLATWNPKSIDWSVTDNAAVRRYLRLQQVPVVAVPKVKPRGAQNPIDRFVMPRWPANEPQPLVCDDSTYIRRVTLDILGVVPTEHDVGIFIHDRSKDKREKLVDDLLSRNEEYAANWVPWWEDALCSSGQHQGGVGTHGNYREWLLKSFEENKPFDTMVLELLDPEMPNHPDRYVLTKSHMVTVQSAADTAQVFLGTAIKCASCHSHFENAEWPQARAVAFASFFSPSDMEIIRCERKTGQFVPAAFPFELPGAPKTVPTDKNLRLRRVAQLIVDPANPRFAKSIVNRLWKRYFGLGIFEPVDDYRDDRPPANPELLNWLADDFMRSGYNIKHTIRMILTSRAYQLKYDPKLEDTFDVSKPTAPRLMRSPSLRRLTAEELLDSIQVVMTQDRSLSNGRLYTQDESTQLLRALGKSSTRNEVSTGRSEEAAVVQALQFLNGPEYHDRIYKGDLVIALSAIEDPAKIVEKMYWSVLDRAPSKEELDLGVKFLQADPAQPTTQPTETVWLDEDPPKDTKQSGNWRYATPAEVKPFSGTKAHVSESTGQSQHVINGLKTTVKPTDKLFTYVYLDPASPPKAIMLQFHAGSNWNHRGYWGDDSIEFTPKRKIGELPKAGGWVRLEVTARELGFNDPVTTIDGVSFDNFDGKCYWDKTGQVNTIPVHSTEIVGDMLWALMTSPEFQYIK